MWIALAVVSVVLTVAVVVWRLTAIGRPTPSDNDPGRQHEVPDAHGS